MFLHRDPAGMWHLIDADGWLADHRFSVEADRSGGVTVRSLESAALWRYDADRGLREAQFPLTGENLDPSLRGLTVRDVRTPGTGDAPETRQLEITGPSTAPGSGFTAAPLTGELADRLPGGFSVTDPDTGRRWDADADGRVVLAGSPVPVSDALPERSSEPTPTDTALIDAAGDAEGAPPGPGTPPPALEPAGGRRRVTLRELMGWRDGSDPSPPVHEPPAVAAPVKPAAPSQPPHAERPWYVGEDGMDALGEVAVTGVDRWDEALTRQWAHRIAYEVRRPGDSAGLEAGIRAALQTLLRGRPVPDTLAGEHARTPAAERDRELDYWETVLQRGQLSTVDGHVVWLRPVLRDVDPLPPAEASPVQQYNINWGLLTTTERSEWEKGLTGDSALLASVSTGARAVASVTPAPVLYVSAHRTGEEQTLRYVIFDRKVANTQGTAFRGGLHMRVFVDGEERAHDVVTPPRFTVSLPKALTTPGGPQHVTHAAVPVGGEEESAAGPHRAREVVNAVDLIPLAAEFQRRLHAAGLPAEGVRALMDRTVALLNERAAMNRSRYLLGNGVVTDRVSFDTGLLGSFKGHVAFHAEVEGLEYLGDSRKVAVREDSGGKLKRHRALGGRSAAGVGVRLAVAPVEVLSLAGEVRRGTGHGLTEETGFHHVINTSEDQARYRAWLKVTVEVRSTTHRIDPVTRVVPSEIGVPAPEAAYFERRLLGRDAPLLRQPPGPDGPVTARPYVRTLLTEAAEHGVGLPEEAYRRPERLDAPPPEPHLREPLALASRRGLGFGIGIGLPGAELVHDQIRAVLGRMYQRLSGRRRVDWSGADRELLISFGRPALEGDLRQLLSGVEHSVRLGGRTYQVSVSARLLERLGGVTGDEARPMSINMRAARVITVGGHRDNIWRVRGFVGARHRFRLLPGVRFQLGQAGLTGGIGGGAKNAFSGASKSAQRIDMGGKADEHVYNVVYELSVRSGGHPPERWWIDRPDEVVARVAVPHLHVPSDPVAEEARSEAGRVRPLAALPTGRVDFRSNGTGVTYRSFLTVPTVAWTAARMYQQANGHPDEWLADRGAWPAELKRMFSPTELATHFPALAGPEGRLLELPDGPDRWHQALRVRVIAAAPRHVTAHGDGRPFHMWQNTSATVRHERTDGRVRALGTAGRIGPIVRFSHQAEDDEAPAGGGEQAKTGHPLTGRLRATVGGSYARERETEQGTGTGVVGITRGTYGGPMHTYRADAVFEVTLERWRGPATTDRMAGRTSGTTSSTQVLEVRHGLEFVVAQRRIPDLGLPMPDGVTIAEPKAPEGHLDLAMLPGGTHPEVLHTHGVLEKMKGWLTEQGVLRPGADGVGHRPSLLLTELDASFSDSALLNQFTVLTTTGVMRWLPIPSAFGSTRYLWARVTAETLEPMSQMDRPEMTLMLRGKAITEQTTSLSRSSEVEAATDLRGRMGSLGHGGLEAAVSYQQSAKTSHEHTDKHLDICEVPLRCQCDGAVTEPASG